MSADAYEVRLGSYVNMTASPPVPYRTSHEVRDERSLSHAEKG